MVFPGTTAIIERYCFYEEIGGFRGPGVRIIKTTSNSNLGSLKATHPDVFFLEEQSLADMVTLMTEPFDYSNLRVVENRYPSSGNVLTEREWGYFALIVRGHSRKEIAQLMHRSVNTIDNHRQSIMEKLGIRGTNAMLARLAAERGWRFYDQVGGCSPKKESLSPPAQAPFGLHK